MSIAAPAQRRQDTSRENDPAFKGATTMRCMLLVKSNEKIEATGSAEERELVEMGRFNAAMAKAGVALASESLLPSSKGARVVLSDGGFTVANGPFADATKLIAGFWTLRTKSKEEAVSWLERIPTSSEVELRPLFDTEDFAVDPAEQPGGWRDQELAAREAAAVTPPQRLPGTKRFILMLKSDVMTESGAPPQEVVLAKMGALMEEGVRDGSLLSGDGLKPSALGVKARTSGAKRSLVDGPFTETKELIAGYTLLQLASLADAVTFAKRWLEIHALVGVSEAEIEIRELAEPGAG
jgi:hypothetical protein